MRILWGVLLGGGLMCLLAYSRSRQRHRSRFDEDLGTVSEQWRAEVRAKGGSDY